MRGLNYARLYLAMTAILILAPLVHAGMHSNDPPAEFLNLETCGGYSKYSCTLREFAEKAFPSNFTRSWAKDGNGDWVLILAGNDVASGKNVRATYTFDKVANEKGTFADPIRINYNGQDVASAYIPNLFIPGCEKAGQATGRTMKVSNVPPKSFLSLKVKKLGDEASVYSFNVADVVNQFKAHGFKVSWEVATPDYVLHLSRDGKKGKLTISEQPVFTQPETTGAYISGKGVQKLLKQMEAATSK